MKDITIYVNEQLSEDWYEYIQKNLSDAELKKIKEIITSFGKEFSKSYKIAVDTLSDEIQISIGWLIKKIDKHDNEPYVEVSPKADKIYDHLRKIKEDGRPNMFGDFIFRLSQEMKINFIAEPGSRNIKADKKYWTAVGKVTGEDLSHLIR